MIPRSSSVPANGCETEFIEFYQLAPFESSNAGSVRNTIALHTTFRGQQPMATVVDAKDIFAEQEKPAAKLVPERAWRREVTVCEEDVTRACPTLQGGRRAGESVEEYAARCQAQLKVALERLAVAREHLAEVLPTRASRRK